MCYNWAMSDDASDSPVPPHLMYLAQQLARDCSGPGIYNIKLTVPAHATSAYMIEIGRYERMRRVPFGRKRGRDVTQDGVHEQVVSELKKRPSTVNFKVCKPKKK